MAQLPLKEEDFETSSATTSEEILALGQSGWTKYDEAVFNGVTYHYYCKPKQFGGFQNQVHKSEKPVNRFLSSQSGEISRASPSFSFQIIIFCKVLF